MLTEKQIERFKQLCKQINFDISFVKNDKTKRALIVGMADLNVYTEAEMLPQFAASPEIQEIYKMVSNDSKEKFNPNNFFGEDRLGIVTGEVPYESVK